MIEIGGLKVPIIVENYSEIGNIPRANFRLRNQ